MLALVADKRRHPSDDMIGHLIEAEVEREDGAVEHLTDVEIARFLALLTAAGSETVTKLVGNGVMTFAEHPDELARLQADPSLAGSAVEEVLRWRGAVAVPGPLLAARPRVPRRTIPAGSPVLIVTGAANRDERAYDDPDRFDIARDGSARHHASATASTTASGPTWPGSRAGRRSPSSTVAGPTSQVDLDAVQYVHMANVAGPVVRPRHHQLGERTRWSFAPASASRAPPATRRSSWCASRPDTTDVDVRCGGEPMRELGTGGDPLPITGEGEATLLGKRYADEDLGLELLCTQGGAGALSVGDTPLLVKGAKPLPSSD